MAKKKKATKARPGSKKTKRKKPAVKSRVRASKRTVKRKKAVTKQKPRARKTTAKRKKAARPAAPRTKAAPARRSGKMAMAEIGIAPVALVTETACLTGAWAPAAGMDVGSNVNFGDTLGSVVFAGDSCDVMASASGEITFMKRASQVNGGFPVCKIQPA